MKQRLTAALHDPSGWALLLANAIPVVGVLFWGWEVFPIMLLFWMENVVVGVFNLLRIVCAGSSAGPMALKIFLVPFFTVHYGVFTMVHGVFVFVLFGGSFFKTGSSVQVDPDVIFEGDFQGLWEVIHHYYLGWALLALVLSHGFSFVWNYLLKGEYRQTNLGTLMAKPYQRVIVLHVVILVGGFVTMLLGAPILALLLLIVLKTGIDLYAHEKEHEPAPAEEGIIQTRG